MVTSTQAALAAGASFKPDVLITEWALSGELCGLDVSRLITSTHPAMKTILLAESPAGASNLAHHRGVTLFAVFEKPTATAQVLSAVARALQH